jgi:hypothetical protein
MIAGASMVVLLTAGPAPGAGTAAHREGSCQGPGEWHLQVSREGPSTIRVRFDITHVDPGDSWQVFLSDNGTRILAGTRVASATGKVHATKITANRSGRDLVKGTGVDVTRGGSCSGAVTY